MSIILDIVIKYWIQLLCTGLAGGGAWLVKRYFALESESRKADQKLFYENLKKDIVSENEELIKKVIKSSEDGDKKLQEQIDSINSEMSNLKTGMLSMQGKEFRGNCRNLLEGDHSITLDEWEEIESDYHAYKALGGNHKGDELFKLVEKKVENTLT